MKKYLSILGSTGSIGVQTLDVVRAFPESFKVLGLSAGTNIDLLIPQIAEFNPEIVSVCHEADAEKLMLRLTENDGFSGSVPRIVFGSSGLDEVATYARSNFVVVAVVGTAALAPTYAAIQQGKTVGLACKEVLVSAGHLMMPAAQMSGAKLLPIDSEHAALKQCLASVKESLDEVDHVILTASGGPFRHYSQAELETVTLAQALKHPNWVMGSKITIDSSTLMNKGLEVIEAHYLFSIPYEQIQVVVHPQSIVHAAVAFLDGTFIAQMGAADMRFPIQYALTYPKKLANPWPKVSFADLQDLQFEAPDTHRFPLLALAFEVGQAGGVLPAIMNAANEAAVGLFLAEKIAYLDIHRVIIKAIEKFGDLPHHSIDLIVAADQQTKAYVASTFG